MKSDQNNETAEPDLRGRYLLYKVLVKSYILIIPTYLDVIGNAKISILI